VWIWAAGGRIVAALSLREAAMPCEGDCKIRMRKKLKALGEVTAHKANPNPPFDKYPKPADYDAAFQKKIDDWMAEKALAPKCGSGCTCEATEDPDWDKKKTHERDFDMEFTANGFKWVVTATVEFKSAIVAGDCIEAKGTPIHLASAAVVPEAGLTIFTEGIEALSPEALEKIRKALA
jgi:hypothetical protein